ncbi:hypothetical protein MYX75_01510 [Acidobacteria bacterium AH-259-A15]|nr:hypothetical protein [Acidobacteria bacterium AH-259-A15]
MTKTTKESPFQALEEELLKKRAEMSELLEEIQHIPSQVTEQLGKISDFAELKKIGGAIAEMEGKVSEKREAIQRMLQDIQDLMASLRKLGERATTEDVRVGMKNLLQQVQEKRESLEKTIREVGQLREHYSKVFLGK